MLTRWSRCRCLSARFNRTVCPRCVCLCLAERTLAGSRTSYQAVCPSMAASCPSSSFFSSVWGTWNVTFRILLFFLEKNVLWSVLLFICECQLVTDRLFFDSLLDWLHAHYLMKPISNILFFISPLLVLGLPSWSFFMQFLIWSFPPTFSVLQQQLRLFKSSLSPFLCPYISAQSHNRVLSWRSIVCFGGSCDTVSKPP